MQKTAVLFFALLFGIVVPSKAQLTLNIAEYVEKQGETIEVPIIVEGFQDILTLQFTFEWDSSVVKYIEADIPSDLSTWNEFSYNDLTAENGFVRLVWFDALLIGESRADGDSIITFTFEVIGQPGDSTLFSLPDLPVPPSYATVQNNDPQTPTIEEGKLNVFMDVGTINPADFGWEIQKSSPNPFDRQTVITFESPQASDVEWSVYDITGKLITNTHKAYPVGINHFVLEQHHLPSNGIYFIQMETPEFVTTQKIEFFR